LAVTAYAQNNPILDKVEPRPKQNAPSLKREDNTNRVQNPNRPQAQQTEQPAQPGDRAQARRGALDHYAASCAVTENENEVRIAQIAQKKAQNPEVKSFAEMLVKDHSAFLEKVRPFDTGAKGTRPIIGNLRKSLEERRGAVGEERKTTRITNEGRPADERDGQEVVRDGAQPAARDGQPQMAHGQFIPVRTLIQVKDEIAQKCLASVQKELQAKQGDEFDRCFIGMQIAAHQHMVDTLSVVQNHVSPELQQVFNEGVETSQRHLTEAKKLMETLEKNRDSQTAGAEKAKRQ
jgi:predicted outer membrane protein